MLSFQYSVPSYFGQFRPGKFLLICLLALGSTLSVSAQTNRDSLDLPPPDTLRGRDAFGIDDPDKPRIDKNGQGRWTNLSSQDSVLGSLKQDSILGSLNQDSLRKAQEGITDTLTKTTDPVVTRPGKGDRGGNQAVKDSLTKATDPVVTRPGKGDRGGNQAVKDSLAKTTDPVVTRPGKGDRGNPPKVDQPDPDSTGKEPVETIVRKDPEQRAIDSTLSRRKLRLANLAPPDPNVALRRSLILPGWGQMYNRSSWKVPIIYAGFGGLGYMFAFNHKEYRYHKLAAICISTGSCTAYPEFDGFSQENVISTREFHRRFRDLSVVIGALWYALNGVDAYVEAHLQPFEVGDDLSLRVKPSILPDPFQQRNVYLGASISLGFGK